MGYTLEKTEQETVINFSRETEQASLYTSDPVWIRKLDKLATEHSDNFKVTRVETYQGKVIAKTYTFPKRFVTIRSKDIERKISEEHRQASSERMKNRHKTNQNI